LVRRSGVLDCDRYRYLRDRFTIKTDVIGGMRGLPGRCFWESQFAYGGPDQRRSRGDRGCPLSPEGRSKAPEKAASYSQTASEIRLR
jgi:hypothetical protein